MSSGPGPAFRLLRGIILVVLVVMGIATIILAGGPG